MKIRKRIAIDMDGVLADTESHYISWYLQHHGIAVDPATLIGQPEGHGFPDRQAVERFLHTAGFFRTLPVMQDAQEVVLALSVNYEIFVVSAAMEFPLSLSEKREWLAEHFPGIGWRHLVFCGDKSIIDADYMIDDHLKNLDVFKGKTLLFNAAHNSHATGHERVQNWKGVQAFFNRELAGASSAA
ncbi:5'(3')-deoxyribonucleotidase [Pedobacter yulinensis]|uniref:5'(3')-deoxyribonucleotidase n=1 Tax=Pedobacter yulinensis TaxID=2126353 RepID=A0A2T3HPH0_9SPHI|nr:5'(3')-deoxyribonucleotidase [Pedobacter yulinensis]PST84326.1 5'(3')-deoxyribonucleotidase [Pedobacter yulinensis]